MSTLTRRDGMMFHLPAAGVPRFAGGYTVTVYAPGAQAAAASTGTTVTVHPGHGFSVDDKLIVVAATEEKPLTYRTVKAVTATTLTLNAALTVDVNEYLVNLGTDTGGASANYDGSSVSIYDDMGQVTALTDSAVTVDEEGNYTYWWTGVRAWELIRDSYGSVVGMSVVPTDPSALNLAYNVRDYGATGDGATDDTAACQSALDAAAAAGGGDVFFPAGAYALTAVLRYGSLVQLRGVGAGSILRPRAGAAAIRLLQPSATGVTHAVIRDLHFDHRGDEYGSDGATPTVSVDKTLGVTVRDCLFTDVQTMAIWCDSVAANPTERLKITGNRIQGSAAGGISLFGSMSNIEISGNQIEDVEDDAIAVQDNGVGNFPTEVVITGNQVRRADVRDAGGSTPNGILVYGAAGVTVTGNTVDKTVSCGIRVQDGANNACGSVQVTGNTVRRAGDTADSTSGVPTVGIFVLGDAGVDDGVISNVAVSGNVVTDSLTTGILVRNALGVVVTSNISEDNAGAGIVLDECADFTCNDNTSMNNGSSTVEPYGILLIDTAGGTKDGVVSNNRSGDNQGVKTQTHGVAFSGSGMGHVLVAGNQLRENLTAALTAVVGDVLVGQNDGEETIIETWVGPNGVRVTRGVVSELVTIAAAATTTTAGNLLPANSLIEAVLARVTVVIPTATSFQVGVAGTAARFGTGIAVAAGSTAVCLDHSDTGKWKQTSTAPILITPQATPADNSGRVRLVVIYRQFTAPES